MLHVNEVHAINFARYKIEVVYYKLILLRITY